MTNRAFLLFLPEASTPEFVSYTKEFLAEHEIVVEEEATIPREELERGRWVEKQYAKVRQYALADSSELPSLLFHSDEIKSRFFEMYHELWDTVMEEGRLLSAKDALTFFGDLTPAQLDNKWWGAFQPQTTMQQIFNAPVKLISGVYLSRFGEGPYYVVNGFYPQMEQRWNLGERRGSQHTVSWMAIQWDEARYSMERVQHEIFGAQDPEAAHPSSLRQIMYSRYEDFHIHRRPTVERCGFELSSSPLEGLALHCLWARRPLSEMPYGKMLLQENMPPMFLERVLSNPLVITADNVTSFFDVVCGLPNSQAVRRLGELYWSLKEADEEYDSDRESFGASDAKRRIKVYDILLGTDPISLTEGCQAEINARRNTAVVFIKPHAYRKLFFTAVEELLAQRIPDLQIDHVLDVEAHLVSTRNIIDRHYGIISQYALEAEPSEIEVSESCQQKFEETYGVRWKDAAVSGRVWNAKSALQLLGHISPQALYELWNNEPVKVKLASGAYICHIPLEGGGAYILNGFYPFVKDMFTASGARTRCYIISWPESALSWRSFRNDVIGCTNPAMAPENSLRGMLYHQWSAFGLPSAPDTTANGVHASAGPIEAMVERNLWFGIPFELDVLTQQVTRCGLSPAPLYLWSGNPVVTVAGTTNLAFDVLENMNTSEVIGLMKEGEEEGKKRVSQSTLNQAVVVLHPHSTTRQTIGIVSDMLQRAGIAIIDHHHIFAHQATEAILDTYAMRDVARYSAMGPDMLYDALSTRARDLFEETFDINWDENMDKIVGADEALEVLECTPFELMLAYSESSPVKIDRHVHAAYLKKKNLYVINGFYPFVKETYTTPGSFMHVFEVSWKEEDWTWEDFSSIVIGDIDVSKAASGTLQRLISENWKDFGLARRSVCRAQCNVSASSGPLQAVVDRLRWFVPAPSRSQKVLQDPFLQRLLLEGIPLEQIKYLMEGVQNLSSLSAIGEEQELLNALSIYQQSSVAAERIAKYSTGLKDALRLEYGFVWLQPSACSDRVKAEFYSFLTSKHIKVVEEGTFSIQEASKKDLLCAPTDSMYRNAMLRNASEVPITPQQKLNFKKFFNLEWELAVQLSLVLNSAQHVARVGMTTGMDQWDKATKKTCISPSLYVAYLEKEGLYVINGFYSFLRSRLYNGHRVAWYSIAWEREQLSYDDLLSKLIGDSDPACAEEGSFRKVLSQNWKDWGLHMPPDALENGVYACRTPMEALSERCRWLEKQPEDDTYGRCLVQSGVHARFLQESIRNPLVHLKGDAVNHITDLFELLPANSSNAGDSLIVLQTGYELTFLPNDTIITQQRPNAITELEDDGLWEEELEGFTEEEKRDFMSDREVTLILRRGISTAYEYTAPFEEPVPIAGQQWWLAGKPSKKRIPASSKSALKQSFAILSVSPVYAASVGEEGEATILALLKDLLHAHNIAVLVEREVPGLEAEARHVFDVQFERLMRYSTKQSGTVSITKEMKAAFEKSTGIPLELSQVRNALELAAEFNLTARKLERVWEICTHHTPLGTDLFVAKVPTEDIFLINGFALQYQETFLNREQPKRFLLVSWDSQAMSYKKFNEEVIGDRFLAKASPVSFHGVLRDKWSTLGLPVAPNAYMGAVSSSESSLQSTQQRQAWLGTGLVTDPLGREAITAGVVSPLILRMALRNPPTEPDGVPLFDVLDGEDASRTLEKLKEMEREYRAQPMRNTALVLVKPHALCKRFAKRVEHVFEKHNIRIEEQGDVSGEAVHDRGLVRYLCPAAAGYAVRNPTSLILTEEEQRRIYNALNVTWEEFVLSDLLLNAYKALEVLGGITPQQLYVLWKSSRHRVLIRPDLEITELEDYHIFVVNAFFPALKQSFETPSALLHYYVISWSEKDLSWAEFNKSVTGARQPSKAEKDSIRGHLFRHWREYGLHTIPDRIQNGIHISEGPLQGLGERLTFLERPIAEDPLGEILDRMKVHPGLLESWLDNPDVQVHQTTAGVFEHVVNYDTSRLIRTLEFLSDDIKAREACKAQGLEYETASMAPEESSLSVSVKEEEEGSVEEEVESMNMSWRSDLPWTEEPIVYRNTSVLLLPPSVTKSPAVKDLLLDTLTRHKVRVVNEVEQESSTKVLDRLFFSDAFFALRSNVMEVLREGQDITKTAKRAFNELFGESFDSVTAPIEKDEEGEAAGAAPALPRLLSAKDAMKMLRLSAEELHVKSSVPGQLRLSLSGCIKVVQLKGLNGADAAGDSIYVVNPSYPFYRQRWEAVDGNKIISVLVVSFDAREHSWKDFRAEVIGEEDPEKAAEGSFRAELWKQWKTLGLAAKPVEVDSGIRDSHGPLQAFAERLQLFGTSDLIPDPLVRSMCMADADPLLLVDWSENPLVAYKSSYSHGEEKKDLKSKVCRVFDLLFEMDTRDLSELIKGAEEHIKVLSRPKDLRLPDLIPDHFRPPQVPLSRRQAASEKAKESQATAAPVKKNATSTVSHSEASALVPATASSAIATSPAMSGRTAASSSRSPSPTRKPLAPHPPPQRLRRRINNAMIQDAIVNATTPEDVKDLWEYYRQRSSCPDKKERYNTAGYGKLVDVMETIDFALFKKDFKSLEMFGIALDAKSSEIGKLFSSIGEDDQMNYNQFARVLALYQTI